MEAAKALDHRQPPRAFPRIAFVAYRDHCDGAARLVPRDFCDEQDVPNLRTFIGGLSATGGGDTPEDIAGALDAALQLNWQSSTRILVHVADAPCHGSKYHNCDDSHPSGDPGGLDPEALLGRLCDKKVDYSFLQLTTITEKMTTIFANVYKSRQGRSFRVVKMDASNPAGALLPAIVESIRASMIASVRAGEVAWDLKV